MVNRSSRSRPSLQALPEFVQPELATLVSTVPEGNDWLHELKYDGYRILCRIDAGRVSLLTRNAQDWTARMGGLAKAAKDLQAREALIDGEVVALDDRGMHDFQLLQNSFKRRDSSDLVYYVFDLLYLDGADLRTVPLLERKETLRRFLSQGAKNQLRQIRFSEHWRGQGKKLFKKACDMGLEGIMAKRVNDPYRSGRGHSWLKIKCVKRQEFVIGGFTEPAGARVGFGALLLGFHDADNALRYAGRVGTGFDDRLLSDLYARLRNLVRPSSPFVNPPKGAAARGVHWIEAMLACEVEFTAWTSDGLLRHPSFKGLREDKPAREITREAPAPLPATPRTKRQS